GDRDDDRERQRAQGGQEPGPCARSLARRAGDRERGQQRDQRRQHVARVEVVGARDRREQRQRDAGEPDPDQQQRPRARRRRRAAQQQPGGGEQEQRSEHAEQERERAAIAEQELLRHLREPYDEGGACDVVGVAALREQQRQQREAGDDERGDGGSRLAAARMAP